MLRRNIWLMAALLLAATAPSALAERARSFDDFRVHYNAVPTGVLQPEVAREYGIVRSRNRGLITVSVLKAGQPVPARLEAEAINLNDQLQRIPMQEIREGNAVYYIGTFSVDHNEKLRFRVDLQPQGADREYELDFSQRFYTEE